MNYGGGQATSNSGEIGALKFAAALLPPAEPLVIFDVGAHQGEYVEAALDALAGRKAQIYSFEPLPSNFVELEMLFRSHANIHTRNAALGAQSGTMELFIAREGITTASLHASKAGETGQSVAVEITTVDEVCADARLGYISFLKIDTEGHEMDVLQGAGKLIEAGGVRAIQFEFGDTFLLTDHHFQEIFFLLAPHYTIYRILRVGLVEIPEYQHDLEIYKLANFLCIHKSLAKTA
jgi:FkbM family methyltransferase